MSFSKVYYKNMVIKVNNKHFELSFQTNYDVLYFHSGTSKNSMLKTKFFSLDMQQDSQPNFTYSSRGLPWPPILLPAFITSSTNNNCSANKGATFNHCFLTQ